MVDTIDHIVLKLLLPHIRYTAMQVVFSLTFLLTQMLDLTNGLFCIYVPKE